MDTYEKKYKAVLEQARDYYNRVQTDYARKELENIFPELRESEDERIRKAIIELIHRTPSSAFESNAEFGFVGATHNEMLSYLEKQKVTPMPNSTELIEMWHKVKAILKEKDFRGDEWRFAQNAFMDGFARGTCVKFEKQKEQKLDDVKREWWNKGYLEGRKNAHIPARELGLPSSWDFQKEQRSAEWGEEDEQIRQSLIEMYKNEHLVSVPIGIHAKDIIHFLENLRHSWKPSEEQMEALNAMNCYGELSYQGQQQLLIDLYQQLKKL